VSELGDETLRKWMQHKKDIGEDNLTWKGFNDFLLSLINDPVNLAREAMKRYMNAKQKTHQSVRDFAAYIKDWEQYMEPYTETQRKEHLRAKVLEEVRVESLKYSKEPETYDAYVTHLQSVEDSIPTRRTAIKLGKKGKAYDKPSSQSESSARERQIPSRPKTSVKCFYCGITGHKQDECRKKARDDRAKSERNIVGESKN
jgi:hypothetical protein